MAKDINREGSYRGTGSFDIPKMGPGPKLGNVGTNKFEGGLKKGAPGIPAIKKLK